MTKQLRPMQYFIFIHKCIFNDIYARNYKKRTTPGQKRRKNCFNKKEIGKNIFRNWFVKKK